MVELNDLEELVLDSLVKKDKEEKYVLDSDLNELQWPKKKMEAAERYLEENDIAHYVETKNERSPKVGDSEFGQYESYGQSPYDKPVYSQVEYNGEEKISEDYSELDEKLMDFVIDNVREVGRGNKKYLSIQLNKITALKLSEEENKYVFDYLDDLGIVVRGMSPNFEEQKNYMYISNYHYKDWPKPLTKDENFELFKRYRKETDPITKKALRDQIVAGNRRLAAMVAFRQIKKQVVRVIDADDLVQIGCQAINEKLDDYDPNKGAFSTFIIPWIRHAIQRGIQDSVPYSISIYEEIGRMWKMEKMLTDSLKRIPSDEELAEAMDISVERLHELKELVLMGNPDEYDDDLVVNNAIEAVVENNELREEIYKLLSTSLKEKELQVILQRFGFIDGHPLTLEEVANNFHVTRERIRQIEAKALRKLKNPVRSRIVETFLHPSQKTIELAEKDEEFFDDKDDDELKPPTI